MSLILTAVVCLTMVGTAFLSGIFGMAGGLILMGVLVFGVGLAAMVAPLTSAVLGDIDSSHAGVASAVASHMHTTRHQARVFKRSSTTPATHL